jgi:hypothetical protein
VAVEPDSCPPLTRGHYAYDFGDTAKLTQAGVIGRLRCALVPARGVKASSGFDEIKKWSAWADHFFRQLLKPWKAAG